MLATLTFVPGVNLLFLLYAILAPAKSSSGSALFELQWQDFVGSCSLLYTDAPGRVLSRRGEASARR